MLVDGGLLLLVLLHGQAGWLVSRHAVVSQSSEAVAAVRLAAEGGRQGSSGQPLHPCLVKWDEAVALSPVSGAVMVGQAEKLRQMQDLKRSAALYPSGWKSEDLASDHDAVPADFLGR